MHAFEESAQFDDNSSVQPVLSVVVIGRNEGQRLARCFESIARIKTVDVKEVIYVDSASTDCSAELASRYGALSITIHPERPTAAFARNTGRRRATSDLILFLDGNTVLHSDFPRVAYDALSMDESIAAVTVLSTRVCQCPYTRSATLAPVPPCRRRSPQATRGDRHFFVALILWAERSQCRVYVPQAST